MGRLPAEQAHIRRHRKRRLIPAPLFASENKIQKPLNRHWTGLIDEVEIPFCFNRLSVRFRLFSLGK